MDIFNTFLFSNMKLSILILTTFLLHASYKTDLQIQGKVFKPNQIITNFGYIDKGDSVEFIFGQQKKINVSGVEVVLEKRINEINQVNVAGDFNGWNPDAVIFQLKKIDSKLFTITICKAIIGKKGELRQFKFVLNHKYWVEPPSEAQNKFTGKDGNTNLTLLL